MSLLLATEMSLLVDAGGAMSAGLLGGWLPLLLALAGQCYSMLRGERQLATPGEPLHVSSSTDHSAQLCYVDR